MTARERGRDGSPLEDPISRPEFVEQVLLLYLTAEGTAGQTSRSDRKLVENCYEQGVTIEEIETAFVLTMARRRFRDPPLPPLDPIRSLHYFVPVLREVRAKSVPVDYVSYLRHKLARIRGGI